MATDQAFHDNPVVKTLVALAALVGVGFVIYDHIIKPVERNGGLEQKTNQTMAGTKNAGQIGQAGRDVSQQANTVHGDQHNDSRREQGVVNNPAQNGGSQNTQINGGEIGSLTIDQAQKDKDPDTIDGAREALGRMGLRFDEESFADANRESNLDALKLYLRGGRSPNSRYNNTFMLCLPLMNKSDQFPAILKLYQTQGREPLNFSTRIGAFMGRVSSSNTMADDMFQRLAYQDDDYARTMGRLLWDSGANPSLLMQSLQKDKSSMERFLSDPQNRRNDAQQRGAGMVNTSEYLTRTNKQLAFLQSVIPK